MFVALGFKVLGFRASRSGLWAPGQDKGSVPKRSYGMEVLHRAFVVQVVRVGNLLSLHGVRGLGNPKSLTLPETTNPVCVFRGSL